MANVRVNGRVKPTKNNNEILISVKPWQVEQLTRIDIDKDYMIEIKEFKNRRSLEQNNLMWGLINEINLAENGFQATKDSEMGIYVNLIKLAQIKRDYVATVEESIPSLEQVYRAVVRHGEIEVNGKQLVRLELYKGSSHFDTEEMSRFIDTLLDYAERVGVDTSEYSH